MSSESDQVACSWVPFDETRSWDEAAAIAVDAAQAQWRAQGVRPSIVSVQQDALNSGPDLIQRAFRDWEYGTLRGKWPQAGPVLAWVPNAEVVQKALRTARGSALIVAEYPDEPPGLWRAWAAQVGAVDLTTGAVTPDQRSDQVKADIEYVIWNGNNGWPSPRDSSTKATAKYLLEVALRGDLDEAVFVAAAVDAGKSQKAIDRLRVLVATAAQQGGHEGPPGERSVTAGRW